MHLVIFCYFKGEFLLNLTNMVCKARHWDGLKENEIKSFLMEKRYK